jgi:hypothetical protein
MARLALPWRANAEGAAGARRPLGRDLRLLPAAQGASAALRPELNPTAAKELGGSMSSQEWKQEWH